MITSTDVSAFFTQAGVLSKVTDPGLRSQALMHLQQVQLVQMQIHLQDLAKGGPLVYPELAP